MDASSDKDKDEDEDEECEHSFILKDDIGYVCRICGVIKKSIESIIDYQYSKVWSYLIHLSFPFGPFSIYFAKIIPKMVPWIWHTSHFWYLTINSPKVVH